MVTLHIHTKSTFKDLQLWNENIPLVCISSSSSSFSSLLWRWLLGSGVSPTKTRYRFFFFFFNLKFRFQALTVVFVSQVVNDVTEFYKETYNNYKNTKQEALKETLRLIHFGVRQISIFLFATTLKILLFQNDCLMLVRQNTVSCGIDLKHELLSSMTKSKTLPEAKPELLMSALTSWC